MLGRGSLRGACVSYLLRAVLLVGITGLAPSRIRAEPLPYAQDVALGRPIHPVRIGLEGGETLTLLRGGKRQTLPARSASEVTLTVTQVADDAAIAVLRVQAADGLWLGLLGGRSGTELLFFERADPIGDPGERRAREIVVNDRSVHTGLRYEGVTACGRRAAWLDAQAVDPVSLTLVPANQPALPSLLDDATVTALSAPTAPPGAPGLRATASSTLDRLSQLPRVPRAVVDGELERGVATRSGELLTFSWSGSPIERLELALRSAKPVELWMLGDGERGVRAVVPGSGARRIAITPPTPMVGHCLALVVVSGDPELRELAAYGALDRPGGIERAITTLVQDDTQAGALAEQLEQLGPSAAEALAARWQELSTPAKRRSLRVLARALDREPVRAAILDSARSDDPELRDAALSTLERTGAPGRAALRTLIDTPGPAGDRAVALLARPEELPTLLTSLASAGGSERASLREAIQSALRKDPARALATITTWRASSPSAPAQVALALALARAGLAGEAAQLADTLLDQAKEFPERYRLANALALATPSAPGDAWLTHEASEAQEWMQRRAAFEALVRRGATDLPALADKLSHDAYPRVRAAAVQPLLMADRRAIVDVMLVEDEWPLVRAQAALALARAPDHRAALEGALADPSSRVRRAAVEALTLARSAVSWPAVEKRARATTEALDVRMAAVTFAGSLCLAQARDTLRALVARIDAPDASEGETELALEALRTLHQLGGKAREDGAALVTRLGAPELAAMWGRLPSSRCIPPGV
jgi:hypothetical protein